MAVRRRAEGKLVVEQTRDLAGVRAMLSRAAMITDGLEWPPACYLVAYLGLEPAGVVGVEPWLQAALIRSLLVVESLRRKGIGRALMNAARRAAQARGALELYAFSTEAGGFFTHFGFEPVPVPRLVAALEGVPQVEYYKSRPAELAGEAAWRLDISRYGSIDR